MKKLLLGLMAGMTGLGALAEVSTPTFFSSDFVDQLFNKNYATPQGYIPMVWRVLYSLNGQITSEITIKTTRLYFLHGAARRQRPVLPADLQAGVLQCSPTSGS